MNRVHVVASGRVQGVFFRASLRDEARRRGATGWVRNAPDGSVEAELQGSRQVIDQLLTFCRRGPGDAVVEDLQVQQVDPLPDESTFEVTR